MSCVSNRSLKEQCLSRHVNIKKQDEKKKERKKILLSAISPENLFLFVRLCLSDLNVFCFLFSLSFSLYENIIERSVQPAWLNQWRSVSQSVSLLMMQTEESI